MDQEVDQSVVLFSMENLGVFERHDATVETKAGRAGCWVKLPNGWTLSLQWGGFTYSSNKEFNPRSTDVPDALTVEIAAWREDGKLVTWRDGDTVQGWCSMERVQHVLDLLADDALMVADDKWMVSDDV